MKPVGRRLAVRGGGRQAGVVPTLRSPVLVGRRAELATALGLVDAAARGRGGALLVTGEAGIGKSRLVDEMRGRAAAAGMTVLRRALGRGRRHLPRGDRGHGPAAARPTPPRRPRRCSPTAPRCAGCCPACRTGSRSRARPTPRSCSAKACSPYWPGVGRCSCLRTSTGPTLTPWTSCATSRARWATRRCCSWRPPATTPRNRASPASPPRCRPLRCNGWTPTAWPRWPRPAAARRSPRPSGTS